MPLFHVHDTFSLQDKSAFVLAGFVLEGEITAGMMVRTPFNANVMMTAEIDRIESVHRPDGEVVCLCLKCSVPDEIVLWDALNLKGRTIEITRTS